MDPVSTAALGWLTEQASSRSEHGLTDAVFHSDVRDALARVAEYGTRHAVQETVPAAQRYIVLISVLHGGDDEPAPETASAADLNEAINARLSRRLDRLADRGLHVDRSRLIGTIADQILSGIRADAASSGPLGPIAAMLSLPPGPPVPVDPAVGLDDGDDEDEDEDEDDEDA